MRLFKKRNRDIGKDVVFVQHTEYRDKLKESHAHVLAGKRLVILKSGKPLLEVVKYGDKS